MALTDGARYQEALRDVRACVAASRTSFGRGMGVLPRARREAMYGLYAFCRVVDDIADDEGSTPQKRRDSLQVWRERIHKLFHQREPSESITQVLAPAIQAYGLQEEDFQTIIDGMAMDADSALCAPSLAVLDLYCDRVASAVGRVSVRIFGDPSVNGQRVAYHLGRALQLTNILRDLAEDALRGRLYLPEELLARHAAASRDPAVVLQDPSLRPVCRDLAAMARGHFSQADAAMRQSFRSTLRPARLMGAYYFAILERLIAEDWRDPFRRVTLSRARKCWLALRGLIT